LFSVTSIYIAVLFYFRFGETISCSKIVGIFLIVCCIILLALGKNASIAADTEVFSESEMMKYALLAILFAILAPIIFTFRAYQTRLIFSKKAFKPRDLAIDGLIASNSILTLLHVAY